MLFIWPFNNSLLQAVRRIGLRFAVMVLLYMRIAKNTRSPYQIIGPFNLQDDDKDLA